nr:unnamed protein product [Callosobruchus analis]
MLGKFTSTSFPTIANHIGSIVYNAVNNSIFISDLDSKKVMEYSLDEDLNRVLEIDSLGWIISMDYDPFANNLYMCDAERNALEVVSLKTLSRRILIRGTEEEILESVAVVPEEGTMFVAMRNPSSGKAHVDRMHMDGTGRAHTIEDDLVGPISLLYDAALHRIFIADAYTGIIDKNYIITGDDRHIFRTLSANPTTMTTIKDELFWMNEHSKKLYWAKKVGSDYNKLITLDVPVRSISQPHIISTWRPVSQHHQNHPCSSGGNCSHLCLPVSSTAAVCACPQGYELSLDDKTSCVHRKTCSEDQFSCWMSESCVPMHARCDGHKDCAHGEDEMTCNGAEGGKVCSKGFFTCHNGACIKESQVCDLRVDCPDKSDEENCEAFRKKKSCPEEHFMCGDGECVSKNSLCDGFDDCRDGSDEKECQATTCLSTQFRLENVLFLDETRIGLRSDDWRIRILRSRGRQASLGAAKSIPKYKGGTVMFWGGIMIAERTPLIRIRQTLTVKYRQTDCPAGFFRCAASGRCIDARLVCDGNEDCGDGSDEPPSCDLRRHQAAASCPGGFACPQGGDCLPAIVKCNGTRECPKGEDEMGCEDRSEEDSICRPDEFECKNKRCIPWQWACDKMADCEDESDETEEVCLRLNNTKTVTHTVAVSTHAEHCKDGFRCKSGDCIQLSLACDGKPDCYDGSDEGGKCKDACSKLACVHDCFPTPHGPMCQCRTGYRPTGNGRNCEDIDECSADPPVCSQMSDKKSCKAEGDPMSLVFLTANNQIRQLSQRTHRLSILFTEPIPRITGLGAVVQPSAIYFAVAEAGVLQKIDLKEDTSHVMQQVGEPQRLAVDWSTDNVYFAEGSTGGITVCHVATAKCASLMTSSPESYHHLGALVVDASEPAIFYAACYVTELTFDHNKRQLYFLDRHSGAIVRVPYDGSENSTTQQRILFKDIFKSAAGLQCDMFKMHAGAASQFVILQDSLQRPVVDPCRNHTCRYLCVASSGANRRSCLCQDGSLGLNTNHRYNVHTKPLSKYQPGTAKHNGGGSLAAAILIPLVLIIIAAVALFVLKKRNYDGAHITMRFHNQTFEAEINDDIDEKTILQPGLHEYMNPIVQFKDTADNSTAAKKQNPFVDIFIFNVILMYVLKMSVNFLIFEYILSIFVLNYTGLLFEIKKSYEISLWSIVHIRGYIIMLKIEIFRHRQVARGEPGPPSETSKI